MRCLTRWAIVGTVAILSAACAKNVTANDLAGKWTGFFSISEADLDAEAKRRGQTPQWAGWMIGQMANTPIPLTLGVDKHYTLNSAGNKAEGTWSLVGRKVSLTAEVSNGQKVADILRAYPQMAPYFIPWEFEVSGDGKTMAGVIPSAELKTTLTFKKDEVH